MQIASITKRVNTTNTELQLQIKINIEIKSLVNFTNCYASQGSQEAHQKTAREIERQKEKQIWKNNHTEAQSDRYEYEDRRGATSMRC